MVVSNVVSCHSPPAVFHAVEGSRPVSGTCRMWGGEGGEGVGGRGREQGEWREQSE